jgi:hypothetical protein
MSEDPCLVVQPLVLGPAFRNDTSGAHIPLVFAAASSSSLVPVSNSGPVGAGACADTHGSALGPTSNSGSFVAGTCANTHQSKRSARRQRAVARAHEEVAREDAAVYRAKAMDMLGRWLEPHHRLSSRDRVRARELAEAADDQASLEIALNALLSMSVLTRDLYLPKS